MLQSEPQLALPIEDQILEAIISNALPAAPAGSPGSVTSSPAHLLTRSLTHPHAPASPLSPSALAAHFHLPLSKLLDILADPRTRSRIAAAQELRDLAFHQREQLAREKALAALESILDTSEDPIEERRAATAILRRHSTRNPFWPRTPGAGAAASTLDEDEDEDDGDPRPALPRPNHPKWGRPARQTLVHLLTHLQDNHNPAPDAGLTNLFLHKERPYDPTPGVLEAKLNDYLEDPGEDAELTSFSCAILHNPEPTPYSVKALPSPNSHSERVTLHWPSHHRTVHFHFTAHRGGDNVAIWTLANLDIGPKESTPDSS
jgi:hypothetical protein